MMGHLKVYRSFEHLQVTPLVERCRTRLLFKGVFRVEGNAIHGLKRSRPKANFAESERDRDNLLRAKILTARENKITLLQEEEKRIE